MRLSHLIYGYTDTARLDLSPNTIRDYSLTYKRLVEHLGDVEFGEIGPADIRGFLLHLADEFELGKKSLCNAWIALSALWTWAETEIGATHIIRGKVKRPKFRTPPVEPIPQESFKKMLDSTSHGKPYRQRGRMTKNRRPTEYRDRAILWVLVDTGLRASELCDLTIADYDEKRGRLHVRHGKGDKARFTPVGATTKRALWRYLADRPDAKPNEPLFSTRTGTHLSRDNLGNLLESIGDVAGVSNVYPHKFRHTFAINFLRNGGNILLLQSILGHESLEMVRRYAKIAESDLDSAVRFSVSDHWR